ncbi:FdtA/QdtA family cupin domain-containing protein [Patescibacteria group bacterium]|nr:FdtA/QdtA family cupin domain-containing protein [Patescibacteria group bacterium]
MNQIKVNNSGIVNLQHYDDSPDGVLVIGESLRSVPFEIKRIYYITNFGDSVAIRGKHAHKELEQIIFCIHGSFLLHLDDGINKQDIIMDDPSVGIKLGNFLWHTMTKFSIDCVILVVASDYYSESDYIRDYKEFLKYVIRD